MSKAQLIVDRLEFVKPNGADKWIARCPAHNDKSPSLTIKELNDGRVLVHCFAGCGAVDILASIGMEMTDLFPDTDDNYRMIGPRKKNTPSEDELLLEICKASRQRGERLSETDKRKEREAFLRVNRKTA